MQCRVAEFAAEFARRIAWVAAYRAMRLRCQDKLRWMASVVEMANEREPGGTRMSDRDLPDLLPPIRSDVRKHGRQGRQGWGATGRKNSTSSC